MNQTQKVSITINTVRDNTEETVTTGGYVTIQEARALLDKYEIKEVQSDVNNIENVL